jgi:hypothetical protein
MLDFVLMKTHISAERGTLGSDELLLPPILQDDVFYETR